MPASLPSAERRDALTAHVFRARLRRLRWVWWVSGVVVYTIWDAVDHFGLQFIGPVFGGLALDWAFVAVIGLLLMLVISHREDNYLARMETLEIERAAVARSIGQAEAVRATARTVAHRLNQPLTAIRGYAELLRDTPPAERDEADLSRILREVDRAAELVRQLLQVTRYETVPTPANTPMLDLDRSVQP
jgi:signal transduction histidine kinase